MCPSHLHRQIYGSSRSSYVAWLRWKDFANVDVLALLKGKGSCSESPQPIREVRSPFLSHAKCRGIQLCYSPTSTYRLRLLTIYQIPKRRIRTLKLSTSRVRREALYVHWRTCCTFCLATSEKSFTARGLDESTYPPHESLLPVSIILRSGGPYPNRSISAKNMCREPIVDKLVYVTLLK